MKILTALLVSFLVAWLTYTLVSVGSPVDAVAASGLVERGRYLTQVGGCTDCHTPWHMTPRGPEPDASRLLSGHPAALALRETPPALPAPWLVAAAATNTAWAGPWGVSFTSNLTPDAETGLGRWDADTFVATIRNGKHMGLGRSLLPPMPRSYAEMTDGDLRAIFAYLQSIPAVQNRVPAPLPPRSSPAAEPR